jgi:hypothetical protein
MKKTAKHIADALGKFIGPLIGTEDKGIKADGSFAGEVILEASQQAVGEFPEHINNEKGGKNNCPGVFLAFDYIEESHGDHSDKNHQSFVIEA